MGGRKASKHACTCTPYDVLEKLFRGGCRGLHLERLLETLVARVCVRRCKCVRLCVLDLEGARLAAFRFRLSSTIRRRSQKRAQLVDGGTWQRVVGCESESASR